MTAPLVPCSRRFKSVVATLLPAAILGIVAMQVSPAKAGPPINQDMAFGTSGQYFSNETYESSIRPVRIVLDSAGRSITFITVNSILGKPKARVLRTTTSGAPDQSFGTNGYTTEIDGESAMSGAVQADGKILLLSMPDSNDETVDMTLRRYTSTGVLDTSFGTGGVVTFSAANGGHWYSLFNETYQMPFATDVRTSLHARAFVGVQASGRIIVAGTSTTSNSWDPLTDTQIDILALTTSGSFDAGFGTAGREHFVPTAGSIPILNDMQLDASGRMVMVATDIAGGTFSEWVMRRSLNGGADTSFDGDSGTGNGYFQVLMGLSRQGGSVTFGSSGEVFVAGWSDGAGDVFITKLNSLGATDASFGSYGTASGPTGLQGSSGPTSLVRQADGKLLMTHVDSGNPVIDRFTSTGAHDLTFGTNGVAPATYETGLIAGAVQQADGRIIAATTITGIDGPVRGEYLSQVRLTANGAFDNSYGTSHRVPVGIFELLGHREDTILLTDSARRIVAVSEWRPEYRTLDEVGLVIKRYLSESVLDTSFGVNGTSGIWLGPVNLSLRDAALDAFDGVAAVGDMWSQDRGDYGLVIRVDGSGDLIGGFAGPNGDEYGTATLSSDANNLHIDAVAVDSMNRIVVGGKREDHVDPMDMSSPTVENGFVARLDEYGRLDLSFDSDGRANFGTSNTNIWVSWVQTDAENRILFEADDGTSSWVGRLQEEGTADPGFGSGGSTFLDYARYVSDVQGSSIKAVLVDVMGRIVVAGYCTLNSGDWVGVVARFSPSGGLDQTFDGDSGIGNGVVTYQVPASTSYFPVRVLADGSSYSVFASLEQDARVDVLTSTGSHDLSIPQGVFTAPLGGWMRDATKLANGSWMVVAQKNFSNTFFSESNDFYARLLSDIPVVPTTEGSGTTTIPTVPASTSTSTTTLPPANGTATSASPTAAPSPGPAVPKAGSGAVRRVSMPVLSHREFVTARSAAVYAGMMIPARGRLYMVVAEESMRYCTIENWVVRALRTGTCKVIVSVTVRTPRRIVVTKEAVFLTSRG